MSPLVSIIIPCFNADKYLFETLTSVINQSFKDYEVIIVNDGSTDNTELIVKKYFNYDNFKLINQLNSGVSSARNTGILNSKGKYIALLDADDIWLKDNLKSKISILENSQNYIFTYSNSITFNSNKKKIKVSNPKVKNLLMCYLLQKELPIFGACSNIIFKNNLNVLFDVNLSTAADQDFVVQLLLIGDAISTDEFLWKYRITENSMSKNATALENDMLYLIKKFKSQNLYPNINFKNKSYSRVYFVLSTNFFVCKSYFKFVLYFMMSILYNPFQIKNYLKKII